MTPGPGRMDPGKEDKEPEPESKVKMRSMSKKVRVKGLIKDCIETLLEIGRELDDDGDDRGGILSSLESIKLVTGQVESECLETGSVREGGHGRGLKKPEGQGGYEDEVDVDSSEEDDQDRLPTTLYPTPSESLHSGLVNNQPVKMKKYFKLPPIEQGYEKKVTIESVESPDYIVVNLAADGGYIGQMLQSFYSSVKPQPLSYVEIEKPCLIESRKVFYRGKVVNIDKDMIQVLLVDKGTIEVKHKNSLFEINDKFLDTTEMSLVVKLAGVRPMSDRTSWPVISTRTLRDRIEGREFLMFVQKERKEESQPVSVILYENYPEKDVCINFWLASVYLARLTSDACMRLEYFKPAVPSSQPEKNSSRSRTETDTTNTFSARVVGIKSPSCILIRSLRNESEQEKLRNQLQQHFKSSHSGRKDSVPGRGEFVGVYLGSSEEWVRGKVKDIYRGTATVQLMDFLETKKVKFEDLRPLPNNLKFGNFTETVHLAKVSPPSLSGNWSREATECLDTIIQESGNKVELKCLGKSVNQSLPVKMLIKDDSGLVDVEDKLVAAGLAMSEEVVRPEPEVRAVRAEPPCEEWKPAQLFRSGSFIKAAVATHVDWDGLVHLVKDPKVSEMISNLLKMKYSGSVARPVDRYWRVGEPAVVESEYYGGWYRVVVLEVLEDVKLCRVKFVDFGTKEYISFSTMRKDLFAMDIPVQTIQLRIDTIKPREGEWKEKELDILHELLVDKTFNVIIEDSEENGDHYVGNLLDVDGEDIGEIVQSRLSQCFQ